MDVFLRKPPNLGWIETKLDENCIDFLWKMIERRSKETYKSNLAGNISKSYQLPDQDDYFFKNIIFPIIRRYRETYNFSMYGEHFTLDPIQTYMDCKVVEPFLKSFWVNYQYQHEVNPYHNHTGVYSFAIWMKIPYHWKDQSQLPFLDGVKESDKKIGCCEFEYIDTLGIIRNYTYRLDPSQEGRMLFFPANLRHSVYPFYDTDEPRISISGNVHYKEGQIKPTQSKKIDIRSKGFK